MNFAQKGDWLVIRLSGPSGVNERLLTRHSIFPSLPYWHPMVILDLEGMKARDVIYSLGVLNLIHKEVLLRGGELWLCSLKPEVFRLFQKNRFDKIFNIGDSPNPPNHDFPGVPHEQE